MPRLRPVRFGALVRAPEAPPLRSELVQPGMRIGLFGGSFNPVHEGHLHVAQEAKRRLLLHRVWWLVSPQNPLKSPDETGDYERRFAAVQRMAREPGFVVSDLERRLGSPYTADTVAALTARHPRARFVWVMGADGLASFHLWRDWTAIMETLPVAVLARPGQALRALSSPAAQHFRERRVHAGDAPAMLEMKPPVWVYLPARLHPASSSALRARARHDLSR